MQLSKALILIDFENEWVDPQSDYFVGDLSKLLERTNRLIVLCRGSGYKIIFTQHVEKDSEDAFAEGSKGVELMKNLDRKPLDTVITKNKISPFFSTSLEKELGGIKDIVVAGILTNLCVRHTIEDAYDRDFRISVIKDCCAALDEDTQEFTFRDLEATRPGIKFMNLKDFLKPQK